MSAKKTCAPPTTRSSAALITPVHTAPSRASRPSGLVCVAHLPAAPSLFASASRAPTLGLGVESLVTRPRPRYRRPVLTALTTVLVTNNRMPPGPPTNSANLLAR
ncbi:hypothetical protein DFH07DRAFT_965301 [Mycena maculata]|uniref:Uncharacterized protein n=1 Tax=Mycena maculata TaxID=230809 RepID=A0AAD7IDQ5_9AGAR|nr:hypothetical protein DFH07DRAFT_965301 [Mycena maculata]